jgi:succinyl-diaminopimelate desuccinylase
MVLASGEVVEAHGKSVHAAHAEKGENAIVKLLKDVKEEPFSTIFDKLKSCDGRFCGLEMRDDVSGNLTVNLGILDFENGNLSFELDIRYPVTKTKDEIKAVLEREFEGFEVVEKDGHDPLFIPPDSPLVKSLLEAYRKATGDFSPPLSIGGGTFARALPSACAFGPIFKTSTIHQPDEYIEIEELKKCAEIYFEALKLLVC